MDAIAKPMIDAGEGTSEAEWLPWLATQAFAALDVGRWLTPANSVIMVAPHPDDEVLAAGGLLLRFAQSGHRVRIIAISDGEASHQNSSEWPRERLVRERPRESRCALQCLGLGAEVVRLGLPDGALAASGRSMAEGVARQCRPGDLLMTTWRGDGHPDHAATALACEIAAVQSYARLIEVPVWAWHWAKPNDPRLPWERARVHPLDRETVRRKQLAVQQFHSQLSTDTSTGQPPILRASTVQRAARPFEIVFT